MWLKRGGPAETVCEIIERNTGLPADDLLHPKGDSEIIGLADAADIVQTAATENTPITIWGDYDADGICGTAILYLALLILGKKAHVRLPKRLSEGYGISEDMVENLQPGLVIIVDNGTSAVEAIQRVKDMGNAVVILDHHIARDDGMLPPADVLVNPQVTPGPGFNDFCGAGLAYRLACLIVQNPAYERALGVLACVATIADVVPLLHDNRKIVMDGLAALNSGIGPAGLHELVRQMRLFDLNETDIGFYIAPALNAPGRLEDDGAMLSYQLLTSTQNLEESAARLIELNTLRKEKKAAALEPLRRLIHEQELANAVPLVVAFTEEENGAIPEGIAGILAGELAREYHTPAFVLTKSSTPGLLKGSGRTFGSIHMKDLLDGAKDLLERYGGHEGAAGLTIAEANLGAFRNRLCEALAGHTGLEEDDALKYDLEVDADDMPRVTTEILRYAPFGAGNERIVLKLSAQSLCPVNNKFYDYFGDMDKSVKLFCGKHFTAVGFGLAQRFVELGEPTVVDLLGTVEANKYLDAFDRQHREMQIRLIDIETGPQEKSTSSLQNAVIGRLAGVLGGSNA